MPEIAGAQQPQQCKQRHQADADRQRRGAPDVGDLQRRRGDVALLVGVFVGRPGDQQQERQRGAGRDQLEIGPHRGPGAGDHRRHPHVLGAAERDRRAQHRQPQEQDRGQFVRPDQRPVQAVARHHAGEQDDDLGDDQQRRRNLDQHPERVLRATPASERRRGAIASPADRSRQFGMSHSGPFAPDYDSLPTDFLQQRPGLVAVFALPLGVEAGGAQLLAERRPVGLVERQALAGQLLLQAGIQLGDIVALVDARRR